MEERIEFLINEVMSAPKKYSFPCFAFHKKGIQDDYLGIKELMKNSKMHFALKSNSEPDILKTLNEINANFEIASVGELEKLIDIGVEGHRIIFSNPISNTETIKKAYKHGVRYFSF